MSDEELLGRMQKEANLPQQLPKINGPETVQDSAPAEAMLAITQSWL